MSEVNHHFLVSLNDDVTTFETNVSKLLKIEISSLEAALYGFERKVFGD